jgi:hypothetical protein
MQVFSVDTVECQVCGARLKTLKGGRHLSTHGMTLAEYRLKFPDAPVTGEYSEMRRREGIRQAWAFGDMRQNRLEADARPEVRKRRSEATKEAMARPEVRAKLLKSVRSSGWLEAHSGHNCHLWRGGVSKEERGTEWTRTLKESVRERYSRCCAWCGKTESEEGKKLAVHHIDYDKQNNEESNLVPLCNSCHSRTNLNRKAWEGLFPFFFRLEAGSIVRRTA